MLCPGPFSVNPLDAAAEGWVDRFEEAWNVGPAPSVRSFLPDVSADDNLNLLCELIRIDMDRRQGRGALRSLQEYLDEFPQLRRSPSAIAELAFEDYRQRLQSAEPVPPSVYSARFDVDTSAWPTPKQIEPDDTHAIHRGNTSTIHFLRQESPRLVTAVAPFPEPGARFLGFELVDILGEGAFARVYLARQSELANRDVVVKVSTEHWSEPQKLARLQHTNIVPVYSVHRHDLFQALCMPFWGRTTLESRLATAVSLPARRNHGFEVEAARLFSRIAAGLAHAHQRGIVHRDLKPANVLITDDGEPMLLDFNLSDDIVVGGRTSLMVGGTLPYMAPEHLWAVLTGNRVDQRCDVYSLGVLLFQYLTGNLPFPVRSGNFAEVISQMTADRSMTTWRQVLPAWLSPDMRSILARCLHPDPARRYPDANQVEVDLARHAAELPLGYAPNRSVVQRGTKWLRRNHWMASTSALLAATVLLVLALTGLTLRYQNGMASIAAREVFRAVQADAQHVRMGLGFQSAPQDLRLELQRTAEAILDRYAVRKDPQWRSRRTVMALPPPERRALEDLVNELHWRLKSAASEPTTAAVERTSAGFRFSKAIAALRNRDYAAASKDLRAWIALHSHDAAAWALYGNALAGLQRYSEAEEALTRAAVLAPAIYFPIFQRGVCRLEHGDFLGADADFTTVLRLKPALVSARFNRAQARAGQQRSEAAVSDLNQILLRQPQHVRALLLRARILEQEDQPEAAHQDRAAAIESTPEDAQGWIDRGLARIGEDPKGALDDFRTATTAFSPSNRVEAQAWQNVFHVAGDVLKDYPTALAAVDEWSKRRPQDPMPIAARAVIWARLGRKGASEEIERALALGRDATTCYQAASCYALMAKENEEWAGRAIDLLRESLRGDLSWFATVVRDPDFRELRSNRDFLKLLGAANRLRGDH